jgi:serine/threonine protein kinase
MNTCNEETSLTMVLEYIPTDLKKHMDVLIEEGERLPASTVKRYMWQLVNGMYYLHRCGVMHRCHPPPPSLPHALRPAPNDVVTRASHNNRNSRTTGRTAVQTC